MLKIITSDVCRTSQFLLEGMVLLTDPLKLFSDIGHILPSTSMKERGHERGNSRILRGRVEGSISPSVSQRGSVQSSTASTSSSLPSARSQGLQLYSSLAQVPV